MSATIAVVEKSPQWTPELQRQLLNDDVRVRQCTTGDVVELAAQPAALVVVLPLESQEAQVLQLLANLSAGKTVGSVVIGSQETAELEAPARELGATVFLANRPTGSDLAAVCRRQLVAAPK